ncbi:MAG: valine--tRNA ligase [Christensenellales bacterium]
MDKKYSPKDIETKIYNSWLQKKYFHPSVSQNKPKYTIIMPPPNITGQLHIGHAFNLTLQDAIIRYKRMQGYEALFLPGTDHAAIATEAKVVDSLKQEGLTKEQIGREAFLKRMQDWYATYGNRIFEQFKKVGISCDWDRKAFTLDEQRSKSVQHAFKKLYDKGYIYRGTKIINWCPCCHTSLSDIEVVYKEHKGYIWHLRYPIKDSSDYIVVATTRPETMFGDVAVAVNPTDEKNAKYIGKTLILPFVNREIPVIGDDYVEKDFGSGFVKITPAHDVNDYEVGMRHNLQVIKVIDENGVLNSECGKFAGLDRLVAREKVVEELKKLNLIEKIEKYDNTNGHCERCGTLVEPNLSAQWFVKMGELAKPAIQKVKDGTIKFHPKRFEKTYLHWMENIKDWCISRQLWSGHQIPAFKCVDCGKWCAFDYDEEHICPHCGSKNLQQEKDVLDTWFSSALWPFSTLGWPEKTPDFNYFYPTNTLVTAYDIIFFWVARMIFSGLEFTGEVPFKDILINGIVRDSQGRKMSKNLGNGVEPISVIEQYGADSLRYSLVSGTSVGQDTRYIPEKVVASSNFINKIWNASNFVLQNIKDIDIKPIVKLNLDIFDKWILTELNKTVKKYCTLMDRFDIGVAINEAHDFAWTKFCDYYIEISKVALKSDDREVVNKTQNVLLYVLTNILKLLHPVIPFATEEIYLSLPNHDESIMISEFPKYTKKLDFAQDSKVVEDVIQVIKLIRNSRSENKIADNKKLKSVKLATNSNQDILFVAKPIIEKLCLVESVDVVSEDVEQKGTVIVANICKISIDYSENIDVAVEIERLETQIDKMQFEIERSNKMLGNANFVAKAPASLVETEKSKLAKNTELLEQLKTELAKLKK